jgi:choline monooxygenase
MTELLTTAALAPQALDYALTLPARFYTDARMPALDAKLFFRAAGSWFVIDRSFWVWATTSLPRLRACRC